MKKNLIGVLLVILFVVNAAVACLVWGNHRFKQGSIQGTGNLLEPDKGRLYEAVTVLRTVPTGEGSAIKYYLPPERAKLTEGKEYCTDRNGVPRELQFK